jgi:hypothetical protein
VEHVARRGVGGFVAVGHVVVVRRLRDFVTMEHVAR